MFVSWCRVNDWLLFPERPWFLPEGKLRATSLTGNTPVFLLARNALNSVSSALTINKWICSEPKRAHTSYHLCRTARCLCFLLHIYFAYYARGLLLLMVWNAFPVVWLLICAVNLPFWSRAYWFCDIITKCFGCFPRKLLLHFYSDCDENKSSLLYNTVSLM